jgi:hypothetical protein
MWAWVSPFEERTWPAGRERACASAAMIVPQSRESHMMCVTDPDTGTLIAWSFTGLYLCRAKVKSVGALDKRRSSRAQSGCRCGRGEPSPGADVGGVSPVPVQMWQG